MVHEADERVTALWDHANDLIDADRFTRDDWLELLRGVLRLISVGLGEEQLEPVIQLAATYGFAENAAELERIVDTEFAALQLPRPSLRPRCPPHGRPRPR